MGTTALIGLGSNLGDRKALLDFAVAALAETPGISVRSVSAYRETAPIGGPGGQGAFLNAAAALDSSLDPRALLRALQRIEAAAGRVRVVRWGERTLDLDLLLFGSEVIDAPTLRVPHPRMCVRRFVLEPLAEIAPDAIEPTTGLSVRELLANLDRRPRCVAVLGRGGEALLDRLAADHRTREGGWLVLTLPEAYARGIQPTFVAATHAEGYPPESWPTRVPILGPSDPGPIVEETLAACRSCE